MKRISLPREKTKYVPTGIYNYPQTERKAAFIKMFTSAAEDPAINERRMNHLKELRGNYH